MAADRRATPKPTLQTTSTDLRRDAGLGLRWARVLALVVTDLTSLFLSGSLAYLLWALPVHGVEGQPPALFLRLSPFLFAFVAAYGLSGLYPGIGLGPVETLRRTSLATVVTFLVLSAVNYAVKSPYLYSRVTLGLTLAFALVAVPLSRIALRAVAAGRRWWREPVVLIGSPGELGPLLDALEGVLHADYRPVGLLTPGDGAVLDKQEGAGTPPILGDLSGLPAVLPVEVRTAVVGGEIGEQQLDRLNLHVSSVVLLRPQGAAPVEGLRVRNLGGYLGIEYTNSLLQRQNRVLKRLIDLLVAGVAMVLTAPLMGVACLAVKLTDPGPAFFVQKRRGLGGAMIRVPKVRTMRTDAEEALAEHLAADPELARQWRERRKLRHDPRVLPVAGPLRRFSLDELPQLWSILKGDMSLVGPRPFPADHLALFAPAFRELRQRVRPGLTGLWQVTVRGSGDIDDQEALDSYYIRNWSLWLDLYIIARTLGAVIRGKGAF